MDKILRKGSHTVSRLTCHIVWATKYRYKVLKEDIQSRCRDLLIQICDAENVTILKGAIGLDHVHMHIVYSPKQMKASLFFIQFKNQLFLEYEEKQI